MANQGPPPPQWPLVVIDRSNVQETVTQTMVTNILAVTPENTKRITTWGKIMWPQECDDPELRMKEWETRWAAYNGVQTRAQLDAKDKLHVSKTFVKLLIAEYKMHLQVNYEPVPGRERGSRKRSTPAAAGRGGDGAGPSEPPPRKRTVVVQVGAAPAPSRPQPVQAQQLADDLAVVARRFSQPEPPPASPGRQQQQRGNSGGVPVPTILRNPDGAQRPDYMGTTFKLADGMGSQDVGTDFQNFRQMLNSLNPLLPQTNPHEHPLYTFQGKMSTALELLKNKCSSIAAAYEQTIKVNNTWNPPQSAETLGPRFAQMESNVMQAVTGLKNMFQDKSQYTHDGGGGASGSGGAGDSRDLMRECQRLREENEKHRQAFETQRARAEELQRNLDRERQRAARTVKLERLNHLEAAGFLVNDRIDPPQATLEAQDLVVMNKPSQYWSEFDQMRWEDLNNQQRKEMMCGWDPTDAASPHPVWASWDKICPICSTIIGPEGGYSTGTCVNCIYHPGCLQSFLLSATRLECASCGVAFNLRLWQAFKCTNLYIGLLPNLGPDGNELPKRTPDMTDEEFGEWHAKQAVLINAHTDILNKIVVNRRRMDDQQFRTHMGGLRNHIRHQAVRLGLVKPEWMEDLALNLMALCLPEPAGMPLFPEMLDETGWLTNPRWPPSFWHPNRGGAPGAGPANP